MALTVRVGVGWSPFEREAVGGPRFWSVVEALEELDYDSLWLSDTATRPGPAPLPVLAAVAARTERLKLGTSVLVAPPRPPALLAKELATIDALSNGRLLPAVGLGVDLPTEVAALGIPREERVARLEEAVAIVRELWRGEPVTYHGRFSSLEDVTLSPRPVRNKLELWLGGASAPALRRVGRIGDGWLASFTSPDEFAGMVDAIREAATAAGRTIDEDHYGTIVLAARSREDVPDLEAIGARLRPGVGLDDVVGFGANGVRTLLERFRAAGATKFVLIPLGGDVEPFLRELKAAAVDPVEAAA